MPKLKNRSSQIPHGFQFYQPQTQWSLPVALNRSFDVSVQEILNYRKGNPGLATQHNMSLDRATIANELDEFNTARCLARGWTGFIIEEQAGYPKQLPPQSVPLAARLQNRVQGVAEAVGNASKAAALLAEWLGEGGLPVASDLSNKRAQVCLQCPQNSDPGWLQKLEASVAMKIRNLVAWKHQLSPPVEGEGKLLTCQVCDCYLPLKVVVPTKHILKGTSAETMAELKTVLTNANERCWVVTEAEAKA